MNDKSFAHYVEKATGIAATTTTAALREVEAVLEQIVDAADSINRVWPFRLLRETRWRLAVRHAEATDYRTHFAHQETWREEGQMSPFCGTARTRKPKSRKRPAEPASLTRDPLEVTCVKCWKRLKDEAEDRLASFEAARTPRAPEEDTEEAA